MRALLVVAALAPLALAGGADEALLRSAGIEPTADGIRPFLRRLGPTPRQRQAAVLLARQLDGTAFERENATRKLALAPAAAVAALKDAVRSPDPEVRRRARPLLERVTRMIPSPQLLAALRLVAERPVRGFAGEVLDVVPLCSDPYAVDCAARALRATAGPDDRGLLLRALEDPAPDTRATALLALAAFGDAADEPRVRERLTDASSLVRIVAARGLLDRGDPLCFHALATLLEDDDPSVRTRAAHALRYAFARSFDYDAFDPPAERAAAARRWRAWIDERRDEQAWRRPLPHAPVVHGRTLIALYDSQRVVELDAFGAVVWERSFTSAPWVVVGLPSGDRIVALFKRNTILRFDREGREVWRRERLPGSPTSLQPLPGGGLLVACGFDGIALELDWDGSKVWEREIRGKPYGLQQLPNGRKLLALGDRGRVIEIDADGHVLWSLKGLLKPYSAARLANGNTLVCELNAGRVSEWTRGGDLVWQVDKLVWIYRAQRLPGGRTLVSERSRVVEVRPDGRRRTVFKTPEEAGPMGPNKAKPDYLWVCRY